MSKKELNTVKIAGLTLVSTSEERLLEFLAFRLAQAKKTFVTTPNPEFLVFARHNPWFKRILSKADVAIPDGVGLVWASRFLRTKPQLKQRISGSDLVAFLLKKAAKKGWGVGIVGARMGKRDERKKLIKKLREKYQGAKIFALEDLLGWKRRDWEIIFACQGMGEQEKWLDRNFDKTKSRVFMGIGGSLDFLTGFAKRAPRWMRGLGLEWLYRLFHEPWRWKRQLRLIEFVWLVIKEKLPS